MSENEKDEENNIEDERKKLAELGIDNTWNILTSSEKKEKKPKENKAFRGFN